MFKNSSKLSLGHSVLLEIFTSLAPPRAINWSYLQYLPALKLLNKIQEMGIKVRLNW